MNRHRYTGNDLYGLLTYFLNLDGACSLLYFVCKGVWNLGHEKQYELINKFDLTLL